MQQGGASTPTRGKGDSHWPSSCFLLFCTSHVLEERDYDFLHVTLHGTSAMTGLTKCH